MSKHAPVSAGHNYTPSHWDDDFRVLLHGLQKAFAEAAPNQMYTTSAWDLPSVFLDAFKTTHERQHHQCDSCAAFLAKFGGLIYYKDGKPVSLWANIKDVPSGYATPVRALQTAVSKAHVTGLFFYNESVWGRKRTGPWDHFNLDVPKKLIFTDLTITSEGAMARANGEMFLMGEYVKEVPRNVAYQVRDTIRSGAVPSATHMQACADWFAALVDGTGDLTWETIGTVPTGWKHIKNTVLGTMYKNLMDGMPLQDAINIAKANTKAGVYKVSTEAPTEGNVDRAENIVTKLGIQPSLKRRVALLSEVKTLWKPTPPKPPKDGVFAALRPSEAPVPQAATGTVQRMSFQRFVRDIMPSMAKMMYLAPHTGPYAAITTAVDPLAPPIISWDRGDERNPFAWYTGVRHTPAVDWNVRGGGWYEVDNIALAPNMWATGSAKDALGDAVFFLLKGVTGVRSDESCLFQSFLRPELREVRSTIEAFSKRTPMEYSPDGDQAVGVGAHAGLPSWSGFVFSVTLQSGVTTTYGIDRWE